MTYLPPDLVPDNFICLSSVRLPCFKGLTQRKHTHTYSLTHTGRVAHGKTVITPPSFPSWKTTVCLENCLENGLLCLILLIPGCDCDQTMSDSTIKPCACSHKLVKDVACSCSDGCILKDDGLPDVLGGFSHPLRIIYSVFSWIRGGDANDGKRQRQQCCLNHTS